MKRLINPLVRAFVLVGLLIALSGLSILTIAQDPYEDLAVALAAIQSTAPTPASQLPEGGTFQSAQHPFDWPPFPGNVHELSAWPLGDGFFLLDDADLDYEALAELTAAAGFPFGEPLMSSRSYTSNDLWLEIHGVTNDCTGWTADLTIHTPEGDTNSSYDLLYSSSLDSPTDWKFLMRCPTNPIAQTNVFARYLCEEQGFFILREVTNSCDLIIITNVTPQEMAERLVPPWVTVTNVNYSGSVAARGVFSNGNCCGLPIDSGVILSSGYITNAIGPNNDDGWAAAGGCAITNGPSNLGMDGDTNLNELTGSGPTHDAALLEFDFVSTDSFTLQVEWILASEEYPEWIGNPPNEFNDPMAIFVSTNHDGIGWIITTNDNIATIPCITNVPVSVGNINGGFIGGVHCNGFAYISSAPPTNAEYYVDNNDPEYDAVAPYSVGASAFTTQYDGMTILLMAQTSISANVTNHVKIAVADYSDYIFDSAIFLKTRTPCP